VVCSTCAPEPQVASHVLARHGRAKPRLLFSPVSSVAMVAGPAPSIWQGGVTSVQFAMHTDSQSSPSAARPHPVLNRAQPSASLEFSPSPVSLKSRLGRGQYSFSKAICTQPVTPLASPPSPPHPARTNCGATTSPPALMRPRHHGSSPSLPRTCGRASTDSLCFNHHFGYVHDMVLVLAS
jgi:hypothetical protein